MRPVKTAMGMQSVTNTKYKRLWNDKNCQVTRCNKKKNPVKQESIYSDKKCQETQDVHIQSVTKSTYMWLAKPTSLQSA